MKNELNFWRSLESYLHKTIKRSSLPHYWRQVGACLMLIVIATSIKYAKYSAVGQTTTLDLITKAAQIGDYNTAQRLWEEQEYKNTEDEELENLVFPERKVEKRIIELEQKLDEYPGNREIYLNLADLYELLEDGRAGEPRPYGEMAAEYREKARLLDPNGVKFK